MRDAGVAIDDLHAYVQTRQTVIQLPHNVHFTPAGCVELANLVAFSIQAELTP